MSSFPSYFILHPNLSVSWSQQEPPHETILWQRIIRFQDAYWNKHNAVILVSCIPHMPYDITPTPVEHEVSVLKSNLQKAVRRGCTDVAVATVWQLLRQGRFDQLELFRRLPIIMLEDTFLNTHILSRWIWWMMATSVGWNLSEEEMIRLCLDVAFVSSCEHNPRREVLGHRRDSVDPSMLFENPKWDMYPHRRTALFAMWIRTQWGGMAGDMSFLRDLFVHWSERPPSDPMWAAAEADPAEALFVPVPLESLYFHVDKHGLPEAADFHCVGYMIADISRRLGASPSDIQDSIWLHRSSVNFRLPFSHPKPPADERSDALWHLFTRIDFRPYVRKAWQPRQSLGRQSSIRQYFGAHRDERLPAAPGHGCTAAASTHTTHAATRGSLLGTATATPAYGVVNTRGRIHTTRPSRVGVLIRQRDR